MRTPSACPVLQQTLDTVDLDAMEDHQNDLELRLKAVERDEDVAGLATAREREQWVKIERIEKALVSADQSDPLVQEMREKTRLLRGRVAVGLQRELQGAVVAHAQRAA